MYGSETMLWEEKEKSSTEGHPQRIALLLGRWIVSNARIRKLCGVKKGLYEMIDEGVVR